MSTVRDFLEWIDEVEEIYTSRRFKYKAFVVRDVVYEYIYRFGDTSTVEEFSSWVSYEASTTDDYAFIEDLALVEEFLYQYQFGVMGYEERC
jgi:hypothetical protein